MLSRTGLGRCLVVSAYVELRVPVSMSSRAGRDRCRVVQASVDVESYELGPYV